MKQQNVRFTVHTCRNKYIEVIEACDMDRVPILVRSLENTGGAVPTVLSQGI